MRAAHGGQPLAPAGVGTVGNIHTGQRGDRHRAFALPVDLEEYGPEVIHRVENISQIHRPAGIDDAAQPLACFPMRAGVSCQSLDHGGGGEHVHAAMMAGEIQDFPLVKAARGGADVARTAQHVQQGIEARAVAHRGGVERGVVAAHLIHIRQIAK